jgi:hypothetical protein
MNQCCPSATASSHHAFSNGCCPRANDLLQLHLKDSQLQNTLANKQLGDSLRSTSSIVRAGDHCGWCTCRIWHSVRCHQATGDVDSTAPMPAAMVACTAHPAFAPD